jgi:hypothetical protein
MRNFTGFTPTHGAHVLSDGFCSPCHTLFVDTFDDDGKITARNVPEQTPYLEWQNSVYSGDGTDNDPERRSCQDCHMPKISEDGLEIAARIARAPNGPDFPRVVERKPFGRHVLVGGNTLLPALIRDNADHFGSVAPRDAFNAVIEATRKQLREDTARLTLEDLKLENGELSFKVKVVNTAGHKFPTGYPSRRAWLRIRVTDQAGVERFSSGSFDKRGRILVKGKVAAFDEAGGPVEPHHREITDSGQVQVYEHVAGGIDKLPAFRLHRSAHTLKDNRLLPRGWMDLGPGFEHTSPIGTADDEDFRGGADTTSVRLKLGRGPFKVEVNLWYQSIASRHLEELWLFDTPEIRVFRHLLEKASLLPELVDEATADVK